MGRRLFSVLTAFLLLFSNFSSLKTHAETVKPNTQGLPAIQVEKEKDKAKETDKGQESDEKASKKVTDKQADEKSTKKDQTPEKTKTNKKNQKAVVKTKAKETEMQAFVKGKNSGKRQIKIVKPKVKEKLVREKANLKKPFSAKREAKSKRIGTFSISDGDDSTGPVINGVTLDKKSAGVGEDVTLSIDATDNTYGVYYAGVNFYNEKYNEYWYSMAYYNVHTNKLEIVYNVGENRADGNWKLYDIYIVNNNWQATYVLNGTDATYNDIDFTVSNPNYADTIPPDVQSVVVDKKIASPGDKVTVSADVTDDVSGVDDVQLYYIMPNGGTTNWLTLQYNASTKKYETQISIDESSYPGTWKIGNIYADDKKSNYKYYDKDSGISLADSEFTVSNDSLDIEGPEFHGITVSRTEVSPGDDITISLDVTDDKSGISQIEVDYTNDDGQSFYRYASYNNETKKYEANYSVTTKTPPGNWQISAIYLWDNAWNRTDIIKGNEGVDLTGGNFHVTNDQYDTTAPEVQSITVDKKVAAIGDKVIVSVEATDNLSGIDDLEVQYYAPNYYYSNWMTLHYNPDSKKYEGEFSVTEDTYPGDWIVYSIYVRDKESNSNWYYSYSGVNFDDAKFTVSNEAKDIQAPELKGLTVDKNTASPGEDVNISLDVTDDKTGVYAVLIRYYNETSGSFEEYATLNEETKKYETKFPVTTKTTPGKWYVYSVTLVDKAGNSRYLYQNDSGVDLTNGDFNVTNDQYDITAPVVTSISVDKKVAQIGDTVKVSIDASDNLSGIDDVEVQYYTPNNYFSNWVILHYNSETKKYEGEFPITNDTYPGDWNVYSIYVRDKEWNTNWYYSNSGVNFEDAVFTVSNEVKDIKAPELNGITVDKKSASPGEDVNISLDVTDDKTGVNAVAVVYYNETRGSIAQYATYNEETKKYEMKFPVTTKTRPGKWYINSVSLWDNAGNIRTLFAGDAGVDLSAGDFDITNDQYDDTAPVVQSISVDKKEAAIGEKVRVSVAATDNLSGIDTVEVRYYSKTPTVSIKTLNLNYNSETEKYEADFPVDEDTNPGDWNVFSVSVIDKFSNVRTYYSYNGVNFDDAKFTVSNEVKDIKAPEFKSVTVDKSDAIPGDQVKISFDVTDDHSGVMAVGVSYLSPSNVSYNFSATKNESTGKYEAVFPVDEKTEPGAWKINYIYLVDNAGNSDTIDHAEQNFDSGNFNVNNTDYDTAAPELKNIKVDKTTASPGEQVKVTLTVTDAQSTVDYVEIQYHNENGFYMTQKAERNGETDEFDAVFPIDDLTKPGTWTVYSVYLSDSQSNSTTLYSHSSFANGNFEVKNDKADTKAPTIKSVSVDKKVAAPGENVTLSVEAEDDQSGVKEVWVSYRNTAHGSTISTELAVYNDETGKYDVTIPITDSTKPGTWQIDMIYVSDKEFNSEYYQNDYDGDYSYADFTVINENADISAPEVHGVSVDKSQANPGDIVTISVDASDDQSGIESLLVNYESPNHVLKTLETVYNESSNRYEAKLKFGEFTRVGVWKIDSIYVIDHEENARSIVNTYSKPYPDIDSMDFSAGNITVINSNEDSQAPVLKGISVSQTTAKPDDEVVVQLDVDDDKSGVADVAVEYTYFKDWVYHRSAVYNEETKKYEVTIPISTMTKPGDWKLTSVNLTDNEGNETSISRDDNQLLLNGDFAVQNDGADVTIPVLHGVSVDKKEAQPGETVTISLDVTDEKSGVEEVAVGLSTKGSIYIWRAAEYNQETHKYEVTLPITEKTRPGQWTIESVYVSDNEGNSDTFINGEDGYDFSQTEFTVINENADVAPPKINQITVDKKEAQSGDKVTITIDASDDKSGIDVISLGLTNMYGDEMDSEAVLNEATGKYEATFEITDETYPGKWSIGSIYISDLEENYTVLYNGEDGNDFSEADFNVKNDKIDVEPPAAPAVDEFTDRSTEITGKTEAGAQVVVYLGEEELADTTADQDGHFAIEIGLKEVGKVFTVYAIDEAGNQSHPTYVTVKDKTAPEAPIVNDITNQSTQVTGKAEPDSTVTVQIGEKMYTGKANTTGDFNITIEKPKAGTEITVTAADVHGNTSEATIVTVSDVTPPDAPSIDEVTDHSETVTGKAEPGSEITIVIGSKEYTGTADENGNFVIEISLQEAGIEITVTATDEAGNTSEVVSIIVKDATPPDAPTVDDVNDQSTEVTGSAEAGATITVVISEHKYTAEADEDGNYKVTIPKQKAETEITVTATDKAGNVSEGTTVIVIDVTPPAAPVVNSVSDQDEEVTGKAEAGTEITVTIDGEDYTDTTDPKGNFRVTIPQQEGGTVISVTATDEAGNVSDETKVTIQDKTAPVVTGVKNNGYYNTDVTIYFNEGTAKLNNVVIKTGYVVKTAGSYTLVVTDQVGNTTTVKFTIDKTAPKVTGVTNNGNYNKDVTITFDEGTATLNNATLTSGTKVTKEGSYTLIVTDAAANKTTIKFKIDKTAPVVKGVANNAYYKANVTITFNEGTATLNGVNILSGKVVKTEGSFTLVVTDAAGNKTTIMFKIDKTKPAPPQVDEISDKSTTVTGKTEAYAKVIVTIGKKTYDKKADAKGKFTITIPKQKAGTLVKVKAVDLAGNIGADRSMKVVDRTKPSKPVIKTTITSKTTEITGEAEANSTILVKVGKKVIARGKASGKGKFTIEMKKQKKKTVLSFTATDANKNESDAAKVTVK